MIKGSPKMKHQSWHVASHSFVRCVIATVALVAADLGHGSNERIPTPCEIEWDMGGAFRSAELPNEQVQSQRRLAENGDAQAQYFMGVAVALDQAERILWLQKARANGSKGAAAYYSFYFDPRWNGDIVRALSTQNDTGTRAPISIELSTTLLQPIIEAAEAGEPQPATWLMKMSRSDMKPCAFRLGTPCMDTHPLIRQGDLVKWAEIAARGGNPAASEYLCIRFEYLGREGSQSASIDDAAFHWCAISAVSACAVTSKGALSRLYRAGRGTKADLALAKYWNERFAASASSQGNRTSVVRTIENRRELTK